MEHYYIGSLTKAGNRFRARKIFMNVLYRVKQFSNFDNYSEILVTIHEVCSPLIGVRHLKKSGQSHSLPSPISSKRTESVVARWVIQSSHQRSDAYTLEDKLVNEIKDILQGKGLTLVKRAEFHKKVISNRVFMKVSFKKPKVVSSFNPYARIFKKIRKVRLLIFYENAFFY
jgi:ribosomal protein S7